MVRHGLARLLQMQPGIAVVGQASNGREAVDLAMRPHPDVVLMDVSMPRVDGLEATRHIRRKRPEARVIGLSMHAEERMAAAMRDAGADAYLAKTEPPPSLIAAIRQPGLTAGWQALMRDLHSQATVRRDGAAAGRSVGIPQAAW